MVRKGARVDLPADGDLLVETAGFVVAVECKRVRSVAGVRHAVRTGSRQLRGRIGLPEHALQVLALDASLLVRPASHLFSAETSEELHAHIATEARTKLEPIRAKCRKLAGPEVDAVLAFVAGAAHIRGIDFWIRPEHGEFLFLKDERFDQLRPFVDLLNANVGTRRP